jgi:hypothetical protein
MLAIGIVVAVIGLLLVLAGFGDFRRAREVRRTPTTPIADVKSDARAEIVGRVAGAVADPVRIPVTTEEAADQAAVYYDLWIGEEVVEKGKSDTVSLASHRAGVSFLVDDGSGTVARVSPERAEMKLDSVSATRLDAMTPAITEFVAQHPTTTKYKGGRVRVVLRRLVAGDTVYVLGRARTEAGNANAAGYRGGASERVVFERANDEAEDLIVSDMSEAALVSDLRTLFVAGVAMLLIGAALGAISVLASRH